MPDRIIRDEILTSDRWLGLKDNADRLVFIAMLLKADDFGNLECGTRQIRQMGADFGITTHEHAAQSLSNLVDAGLVMVYEFQHEDDRAGPKQYAHIPKFKQRIRFPRSTHPMPDWQAETYSPDITASAWRDKVRPAILRRDNHQCALCGATAWLHVDHAVPLAKGGKSVPENLITLCRKCNTKKATSMELSQQLQDIAEKRQLTVNRPTIDKQMRVSAEVKRSEEKRSEVNKLAPSSDAQKSKPVDKVSGQVPPPKPNETATEYAMRIEGLARSIVKPFPKK